MEIPTTGRVFGLDWGSLRFGVATTDETQTIATPLATLVRRAGKRFPMPGFLALVTEHRPVGIVVGLPLTLEGAEEAAAAEARALAQRVAARTALPTLLWDERFSSARAHRIIREQGGSVRGRRGDVDALAAAIMLQQWLESRRTPPS